MSIIETQSLTRRYGNRRGIEAVTLRVLLVVATLMWVSAGLAFARRDLATT